MLGLRKKTVAPGSSGFDENIRGSTSGSTDLFGTADAIVKHVLEVSQQKLSNKDLLSHMFVFYHFGFISKDQFNYAFLSQGVLWHYYSWEHMISFLSTHY